MARRDGKKWRADVCVNGKRKGKMCDTEEEAKKVEVSLRHQLIDGRPLNKVRALSQITLKQAFETGLNNPEAGWVVDSEPTAHGRKQKYYANAFNDLDRKSVV